MKPLNRPMFKYGGPIKEGIMTGMKDSPQQLVKSNADGSRPGYAGPALLALPYIGTAARFLARPFGQFITKQMAKRGVTGSGGTIRSGLGRSRVLKPGEKLTEDVTKFKPNIFGKYLAGSPEGRLLTGGAGYAGKAGQTIFKAGKGLAKSPLTLATAGYYGGKKLIDQFKDDPIKEGEIPGQSTSAINKAKAAIGMPENLTYGGGREPTIDDPNKTDELTKDRIQKTKERYYKLMGLDNMKKDAVYDSLIDASKIIQQEGGDLKGSIKSGSLQTQIIDAISKQLDKSAGIKRQIDAAVLKGEIEKDINKEKNQLDAEYKKAAIKKMEAADGTLLSDIRSFVDKYQTLPSGTALAGLAKTRGMDIVKIADTQEVTDWVSKNGGDEEDFIKSMIQDPENEVAPGVHVVNNALIEVGADGSVTKLF
jgi:hypothetical protein